MGATAERPTLGRTGQHRGDTARTGQPRDWRAYAACRGVGSLFFTTDVERTPNHRIMKAKAVCERCPVRSQCAAYALAVAEPHGIWGGFTESERMLLGATDWRQFADRRCVRVDVAELQARLHAIRAAARRANARP